MYYVEFLLCHLSLFGKLLLNSILGALLILLINFIGGYFNFHIGLNFFTIILVSLLGIPGALLLTVINLILL
ncbi:MAG: sigmaK-factor processing regulatory BofA [Clostridia bacterium]|nr:sigmaK-factor processing regulatory BofA [Clostridia bacterium]